MHETPDELLELQRLLDRSMELAGPHLRTIVSGERRLTAAALSDRLQGMRLLVVATVTADGRPLTAPVDGYLLHGSFHFSTGSAAVKLAHLARRPAVSATHLPGEELAVTVHGRAETYRVLDPGRPDLRRAMLDHYLPLQGPAFEAWLTAEDPVGVRIVADRLLTFHLGEAGPPGEHGTA